MRSCNTRSTLTSVRCMEANSLLCRNESLTASCSQKVRRSRYALERILLRPAPDKCSDYTREMARKQAKQDDEIDVVDWLRKLPKCEFHLHLEGAIQPETLLEVRRRPGGEPPTPEAATKLIVYENFLGFLDSFKAVSGRLKGPDDYELITYNMIRELAAQGVVHAEVYISFGIIYYWKQVEVEPYVEAIERGRVRGERDFGTTILWIIDAVRHFGADEALRVFRKAAELRQLYPSIVGIGIGGDEARGSADLFREAYAEAKAAGLR